MFAYNIGPGVLNSYVALSLDGTKVAFNENNASGTSYFHVLKWSSAVGNSTSASAAVAAPVMIDSGSQKI